MSAEAWKVNECRSLTPEELQEDLGQFGQSVEREWLRDENPLFFWTWMQHLQTECGRHEQPVPEWLDSLLEELPDDPDSLPGTSAEPSVVLA